MSLKSNNIYNDALAVINDTITLTFILSEKLYHDPSVIISAKQAKLTKSGLSYAASITAQPTDPQGVVDFLIFGGYDFAGNLQNNQTSVTDGSGVVVGKLFVYVNVFIFIYLIHML